jgi:hypothetical protein
MIRISLNYESFKDKLPLIKLIGTKIMFRMGQVFKIFMFFIKML